MRAVLLGLLAAALLIEAVDAQPPEPLSANNMLPKCQKLLARQTPQQGQFDEGVCLGTIEGLAYTITFLPRQFSSCPPKGGVVTMEQMIRVVVAYVERRPQRMHEDFRGLAIEAMHEAWPCKG
jgi:Rap1a immunity proteins